ncbi:MAG: hypothetical protein IKW81_12805 [Pseudobutyrivibrio sp.]|nr:hypothetical protein [Pseudobutyrivibrio sp.]
MDENRKKIQREIAKDKIQVILSGIGVAVLVVMELYIMINYASNFMLMAVGVLLMIVALFFLISAVLDMSLKTKDMEEQKYEEIYNAQKASYLVIKKSFDEMDQRLRNIEESSALPAEDIINAQKAVAKVTISRSKENTDALMNSNDELINQLFSIKEKLESNNSQMIEKQQALLKETNFDIQQKIAALTNQISNIEGKIQSGIPVMAQPVQMAAPVMQAMPQMEEPQVEAPQMELPQMEEPQIEIEEAIPELEDVIEEASIEEATDELGLDLDIPIEEEPLPEEEGVEEAVEDLGIDLEMPIEEEPIEEATTEEVLDDEISLEPPVEDEISLEEVPVEEEVQVEEEISLEAPVEENIEVEAESKELPAEDISLEEQPTEEPAPEEVAEEIVLEDSPIEETPVEEIPQEEPVVEQEASEEIILEETPEEEVILTEEPAADGVDLDALLEEVGGAIEEEPAPEPESEPEPPAEENNDEIVIPDVGVDLTDPNRVMSAEEIEKLFANI